MTMINDETMQPTSTLNQATQKIGKEWLKAAERVYDTPVPNQSPSEYIHNKLLNLRDGLDQVCARFDEKLAPVMNDCPNLPETAGINTNSDLPPLFRQYNELIDHIELVVRDINVKLDNVDI